MKKKFGVILLIAFFAFFSGCRDKKEGITFAVGGAPSEIEVIESVISDFTAAKGIKVNIIRQPTDSDLRRQGLVIPLRAKKSEPDVFLMDVAWVAQFAASGWLEPIGENIPDVSVFFEKIRQNADTYDNVLYALPVNVDGGLLYYRKDLLKKYGYSSPPKTWDELTAMSLKVQKGERKHDPGFYGFVWQGAQYEGLICTFTEFAASTGGGITVKDGKIIVNTKENAAALGYMRELVGKYKISPPNTYTEMKEEEVRTAFQKGSALFERNWPYAWALHNGADSAVKGKTGVAPLPGGKPGKSASALGGWHAGVSKFSKYKAKSFELVNYLLSYEVQKKLALKLAWNPGRQDVYGDVQVLKAMPHFAYLKKAFENAAARPPVPYYTQVSETLQKNLNSALSGSAAPEAALKAAAEEISSLEERYGGK